MRDDKEYINLRKKIEELQKEIEDKNKLNEKFKNRRNWLLKKMMIPIIGINLKDSIVKAIEEFNVKKSLSKDTIANLGANIIWRMTRIGLFTLIISGIPVCLLIQQNSLLRSQNTKIDQQTYLFKSQNKFIEQQSFLSEASRRSAQMIILGDILSDLNKELENENNKEKILSNTLVGRIISISSVMKPYRYLENGELTEKPLSPERGQLLISLISSNIDTAFFRERILKKCDFSFSDLQYATIQNAYLSEAKLSNSNFKGAKIFNSNFKFAELSGSDFQGCVVLNNNFKQSFLGSSKIHNSIFANSNYENAAMNGTNISDTDFGGSNMKGVSFNNAILNQINFVDVEIGKSIYYDTRMIHKEKNNKFLRRKTNTSFKDVKYINNITVDRKDWIEYARDSLEIEGLDRRMNVSKIGSHSPYFGHRHGKDGERIDLFELKIEHTSVNKK